MARLGKGKGRLIALFLFFLEIRPRIRRRERAVRERVMDDHHPRVIAVSCQRGFNAINRVLPVIQKRRRVIDAVAVRVGHGDDEVGHRF